MQAGFERFENLAPEVESRRVALQVAWVGFFALLAVWAAVAARTPTEARWGVAAVAAPAASLALGRLVSRAGRAVVPLILAGLGLATAYTGYDELFSSRALAGPFGYANAKAAFYSLIAIALLMVAVGRGPLPLRLVAIPPAVIAGSVAIASKSLAISTLVLVLPLLALAVRSPRMARRLSVALAIAFVSALLGTLLFAAVRPSQSGPAGMVVRALSERRIDLWNEALGIMLDHPTEGVGTGRYAEVSRIAGDDPPFFWAHNEFLQYGAEQGFPGFVLLASVFIWGFAALAMRRSPDRASALAAAALALVGIHSCIDAVLHFAPISMSIAALVGSETGR